MDATPPEPSAPRPTHRVPMAPTVAVLLAILFGLAGGYLDLVLMLLNKTLFDEDGYFRTGRDFPWSVPAGHVLFLMIPGGVVAAVNRLRPGVVSMRAGTWLLATLAIWGALLRMPLYGACTLLLSAGLARPIGGAVAVLVRAAAAPVVRSGGTPRCADRLGGHSRPSGRPSGNPLRWPGCLRRPRTRATSC